MKLPSLKRAARWLFRLLVLAGAVFLAIGGPIPYWTRRIIPQLSPFLLVTDTIAGRWWYAGLFWGLPPLAVLLVAVFRGRFFCRWICPTGTLHSMASIVSLKKRLLRRRLNGILFWTILAGGIGGFPFLVGADPLSTFNRLTPLTMAYSTAVLIPGLVLPVFMVLGLIQPVLWCSHFCPLGYTFDLAHIKAKKPLLKDQRTRRDIVIGGAIGLPLALLGRFIGLTPKNTAKELPILPPGAKDPKTFAALCSRCYACVNACPTNVLRIRMPIERTPGQFFHPELDTHFSYCEEFCNQCSQVCPAGAIRPLDEDTKRTRKIGTAKVIRDACLAWADKEVCMVCDEYCPYHAIRSDEDAEGLPRPIVDPDVCRGCGICQANCPAERQGRAIIVHGIPAQKTAKEAPMPDLDQEEEENLDAFPAG